MRMTVHGTEGPVVVKLAGIAGGVRLYDEEVDAVAAAGFRVAAIDVTGDRHDDPRGIPLDWDRYGREVVEAIDRIPSEQAILWGTSFGCLIALAAAARHPGRIGGLLLTHPPDPLQRSRLHVALLEFAEQRSGADLVVRWMFAFAFVGLTSWEAISPALWLRLPSLSRVAIEAATPAATVRRKLALLFRDDPGLPPPAAAIPVEIIAGSGDLVAPAAGARRIASRIPGAKLHVLGYSGHAGAFARPRAHSELVIAAMKRLARIDA